jgi:uncharacterized SAM-binding protein YcdF (DUF218 family)
VFQAWKLLEQALDPRMVLFLVLILGTALSWTRARAAGRRLVTLAVAIALLLSLFPIGSSVLAILENRFPVPELPAQVDGIIALGGDFSAADAEARGPLAVASPRVNGLAALARRYPDARLVFSGGSARVLRPDLREADQAARMLESLGIDPRRLTLERDSRNTYENALFSKRLIDPKPAERWILVTSAAHMPRAVGTFRKAGWPVIGYPVGFLTGAAAPERIRLQFDSGLSDLQIVLREYLGLAVYYLRGRTDALFPSP